MAIPEPTPGLVFRYEYLWKDQFLAGRDAAAKDRPACVVLAIGRAEGDMRVLIVPITRSEPKRGVPAVELPPRVKQHLGLDDARSWIILSEANLDCWPSPDMRQVPGKPGQFDYELLPLALVTRLREAILAGLADKRMSLVDRAKTPITRPRRP